MTAKVEVLFENKWISLVQASDDERGIPGYVYSRETRCGSRVVAVLPYRASAAYVGSGGMPHILLHSENNPAWDWGPNLASITGGQETDEPAKDAAREVREETGYQVTPSMLYSLGTCRGGKSVDTVYSLFTVDLDGAVLGEVDADSVLEATEHPVWATWGTAMLSPDPLVSVMMLRLQALL